MSDYLSFKLAEYTNLFNEEQAQELLKTSVRYGCKIVRPWHGIQYSKLLNKNTPQSNSLNEYMIEANLSPNGYVMRMHALCEKLRFAPESSSQFEQAIMDLGLMLGLSSNRPECDYGKGPDNLWALGNGVYLVIECKNETTTETICKHDCNQLNGSIEWFNAEYEGNNFTCVPVMIHNSSIFERACSPNSHIRIITPQKLELLNKNLIQFAAVIASRYSVDGILSISNALKQFKLTGSQFADEYTTNFTVKQ